MAIQHKREWFLRELGDMLDVENQQAQILPQLAREVRNEEIKAAFLQHAAEIRQQVRNLERCFNVLRMPPEHTPSLAMERLKQEHASFVRNEPSPDFLTMFDLHGATRSARYKIASYQGLITQAEMMEQQECVNLLKQNLRQEEAMARKVAHFSHELAPQLRPE
jgi:ferritin-like metal-binding protein YciE